MGDMDSRKSARCLTAGAMPNELPKIRQMEDLPADLTAFS